MLTGLSLLPQHFGRCSTLFRRNIHQDGRWWKASSLTAETRLRKLSGIDLFDVSRNMQDNTNVLSLHRLEPVVNKFIKVAIPTDLERLDKHRMNMEKSRQLQDWKNVNREQINASRTVQQLKHNLRELESLRIRLRAIDQPTFDDRVRPTQDRAATVVQDFLALHKAMQQAPGCPKLETSEETMLTSDKANVVLDDATDAAPCGAGACITECADQEAQQVQLQVQQQQIEESWEHLAKDLHELDNLVTEFSQLVYVQQETMDSITENVERASDNVAEGTQQLGKAVQGAATVLPVAGAILGGAVAGPLGLLAGLKVGGLIAALGGGLLGFTGGRVIQKHRQKQANQELQKLSSSNAS